MRPSKQARQALIQKVITERKIQRQEDLVQALEAEGLIVTQATVSRDVAQMNLIKVPQAEGGFAYAMMSASDYLGQLDQMLREAGTNYRTQANMVMFTVAPGSGPALKNTLEAANFPEVFGLLGDDASVLMVLDQTVAGETFMQQVMAQMPG